jgi:dUTPase
VERRRWPDRRAITVIIIWAAAAVDIVISWADRFCQIIIQRMMVRQFKLVVLRRWAAAGL